MLASSSTFEAVVKRSAPIYFIQPREIPYDRERDRYPLLLGGRLNTVSLALGPTTERKFNARKLHVKSDAPSGVTLRNLPVRPRDPHDIFGFVGGGRFFVEEILSLSHGFSFSVEAAMGQEGIRISGIDTREPTLVIHRDALAHSQPKLIHAEADPYFAAINDSPMVFLDQEFGSVVDGVRRDIEEGRYLLVN